MKSSLYALTLGLFLGIAGCGTDEGPATRQIDKSAPKPTAASKSNGASAAAPPVIK